MRINQFARFFRVWIWNLFRIWIVGQFSRTEFIPFAFSAKTGKRNKFRSTPDFGSFFLGEGLCQTFSPSTLGGTLATTEFVCFIGVVVWD